MSLTDLLWEWHPTYYSTTFTECMVRCLILYTWQQDGKDLNSEIKRCGPTYCPCSVWTSKLNLEELKASLPLANLS